MGSLSNLIHSPCTNLTFPTVPDEPKNESYLEESVTAESSATVSVPNWKLLLAKVTFVDVVAVILFYCDFSTWTHFKC
jgi:hypothetical protein